MRRFVVVITLVLATTALAERRFALVVGANNGWATDRTLRYAHDDARRMQEVLLQLGGFAAADTALLLDPTTRELLSALEQLEAQVAATRETTFLYFYYSGHSDAAALHLRGPVLNLGALADRLSTSKASLSLAVFDACRSGAVLGTKGAAPISAPMVRLQADEPVQGFALLSSSGADELAQESKALAGSLFTHHWISALRGAGDVDGDGVVRLTEAYQYAYERTRSDTEATSLPQSPGFRFSLKGQGDVPLTRLIAAAGTLELEVEDSRRYVVVDGNEQRLVAEARSHPSERRRLQLVPGSYRVKRPASDGIDVAEVTLAPGAVLWAARLPYRREPLERGLVKGSTALQEWAASGRLAEGDVDAALSMFQHILDENPHEARARRGKARALLVRSQELNAAGQYDQELKALQEALALDSTFADDPSVARFAERSKVLHAELERQKAVQQVVDKEVADNPRVTRRWGLGFQLVSTKGILVLEGHYLPKWWLSISGAADLIGPGVDLSVKVMPLVSNWTPTASFGFHYGFDAWGRTTSSISVNGMVTGLSYDDYWGKTFHAELGLQWMDKGGFAAEFNAGPMLFFNQRSGQWEWFGFFSLGVGWYFH